jgi:hypothetical protein
MIGNTNNPRAGPAIRALAIGMPLTTDFCDPQNTIALSSARLNLNARLALIMISSATAGPQQTAREAARRLAEAPQD